jgi:hypothetical protein
MRHSWNQSCHVINCRVAEHSKKCISRQSVDDLSLIDDGSTQPGQEWRGAIAARMLTKLHEKSKSGSTVGNRIARARRSAA